jgi:hypothetical protein
MYEASILPAAGTAPRRVKRRIWHLAEETPAWTQQGLKGKVAHDHAAKLVSVTTLYVGCLRGSFYAHGFSICSPSCRYRPQPLVIEVPFYDEDETGPPVTGGKTYTLTIKYVQDIDMSTLVKYLAHDPQVGTLFQPGHDKLRRKHIVSWCGHCTDGRRIESRPECTRCALSWWRRRGWPEQVLFPFLDAAPRELGRRTRGVEGE